jgi:hypothetical protein
VTDARFEELVQRVLDDELTEPEAVELAAELRARPARQIDLREHLALWDLWSQQLAPERSADAFLAACRTRLAADRGSAEFVNAVTARVQLGESDRRGRNGVLRHAWQRWLHGWRPTVTMGWTAACAALVVVVLWFATPHPLQATTVLRGEAVCTACLLHQGHEHTPAIRVHAPGGEELFYVVSDPMTVFRMGNFCRAPVPLVARGATGVREGRHVITISAVEADRTAPPAPPAPDQRVLFPF